MNEPLHDDNYAAVGLGAEHFKAPAVFYLTHAEAIESWHDLRGEAIEATAAFLDTLLDDFEPPPVAATWEVTTASTSGRFRHHLIAPLECPPAADGTPALAVCVGWHTTRVWLPPSDYTPFVGVRIGEGTPDASAWREEFLRGPGAAALEIRKRTGYRRSMEWPVWKEVPASGEWWHALDTYRAQLLSALEACVTNFAGEIDRTVTARGGTAQVGPAEGPLPSP